MLPAVQLEIPSIPTKRGRLLTCGQGDVGQLGLGEDVQEVTRSVTMITVLAVQ